MRKKKPLTDEQEAQAEAKEARAEARKQVEEARKHVGKMPKGGDHLTDDELVDIIVNPNYNASRMANEAVSCSYCRRILASIDLEEWANADPPSNEVIYLE